MRGEGGDREGIEEQRCVADLVVSEVEHLQRLVALPREEVERVQAGAGTDTVAVHADGSGGANCVGIGIFRVVSACCVRVAERVVRLKKALASGSG